MSDITPIFNDALKSKNSPEVVSRKLDLQKIEEFLKEAYRINEYITSLTAYLRSIRQSYLSTTKPPRLPTAGTSTSTPKWQPLTNLQRDQIDAETKRILREINAHICNLADAEQLRQNTQTSLARKKYSKLKFGVLGSWAAGGVDDVMRKSEDRLFEEARAATIRMHREEVILFLRDRLKLAASAQAGMMQVRLGREVEMGKSLLGHAHGKFGVAYAEMSGSGGSASASTTQQQQYQGGEAVRMEEEIEEKENWERNLTPEQQQEFEKDNRDMIKHHQSTLSKVNKAQESLLEISNLQSQLVANLTTQTEHISQLQADSEFTVEHVGGANRELKRATERGSTAKWVFYASCGLSAALVLWDLVL